MYLVICLHFLYTRTELQFKNKCVFRMKHGSTREVIFRCWIIQHTGKCHTALYVIIIKVSLSQKGIQISFYFVLRFSHFGAILQLLD